MFFFQVVLILFVLFHSFDSLRVLNPTNYANYVSQYSTTLLLLRHDNCTKCPEVLNVFQYLEKLLGDLHQERYETGSSSSSSSDSLSRRSLLGLAQVFVDENAAFLEKNKFGLRKLFLGTRLEVGPDVPVLVVSHFGKIFRLYDGPKDVNGMFAFLTNPKAVSQILTNEQKRDFLAPFDKVRIMGYFPTTPRSGGAGDDASMASVGSDGQVAVPKWWTMLTVAYGQVANFGVVRKSSIGKSVGLKKYGDVLMQYPFEKKKIFRMDDAKEFLVTQKEAKKKKKKRKATSRRIKLTTQNTFQAFSFWIEDQGLDETKNKARGRLLPVSSENVMRIISTHLNVFVGFVQDYSSSSERRFLKTFRDVAGHEVAQRKDPSTVFAYTLGPPIEDYLKSLGLDVLNYPELVAMSPRANRVHVFDKSKGSVFDKGPLRAFVHAYFENLLAQSYKSQEVPADNVLRDLKVLTADTFDAVIRGSDEGIGKKTIGRGGDSGDGDGGRARISVVFFHRESCPHCKAMHPEVVQLAAAMRDYPDVVVGSLDVIENVAPIETEYVPVLAMFRGCHKLVEMDENGKPKYLFVEYQGNRTAADMIPWVLGGRCPSVEVTVGKEESLYET